MKGIRVPVLIGNMEEKRRKILEDFIVKYVTSRYFTIKSTILTYYKLETSVVYNVWMEIGSGNLNNMNTEIKQNIHNKLKQGLLLFWEPGIRQTIGVIQFFEKE